MKIKIAATFALVAGMLISSTPHATPVEQPASPTCDLVTEVNERVDQLGETGRSTWIIDPVAEPGYWGYVEAGEVVHISPAVTCDAVRDVVNHEWMHLLQGRAFTRGAAAYGTHEQFELVADCGSKLLGSSYTPYEAHIRPCGTAEYESAMWLIERAGKQGMVAAPTQ